MAILIPSKHIYGKENPKVRDNVIERIEVGAVEVVQDNDYETPVYNNKYEVNGGVASLKKTDLQGDIYNLTGGTYSASACYVSLTPYYSNNIEIYIPIVSNNKYIDDLLLGVDKDNNENIKLRVVGSIIKKNATATMDYSGGTANMKISDISYSDEELISSNQTINISSLKETYDLEYIFDLNQNSSHIIAEVNINQKDLSINATYSWNATANSSIKINSLSNIYSIEKATPITINGVEYYKIELKVLCGVEYDILAGNGFYYRDGTYENEIWEMKGVNYKYTPEQFEITVYGNTIGIDLQDKTIYINGETAKKVHSVEGNELLQTSNYIKQNATNTNAIDKMYGDTKNAYANGKETATIRCSISNYYDYYTNSLAVSPNLISVHYGRRVLSETLTIYEEISVGQVYTVDVLVIYTLDGIKHQAIIPKGNTSVEISYDARAFFEIVFVGYIKMAFEEYDQVIPMVYGADGQDRPMSLNKDGSPKIFTVLGTKIFYDGAIWQEISLQEA